jgi:hypothetical protein
LPGFLVFAVEVGILNRVSQPDGTAAVIAIDVADTVNTAMRLLVCNG